MYYLEVSEGGHRIPAGNGLGYKTLEEAKAAAQKRVDDAMPSNTVWILEKVGYAALAGDGGTYVRVEPKHRTDFGEMAVLLSPCKDEEDAVEMLKSHGWTKEEFIAETQRREALTDVI